jgi:pimeloyl-ACP methyl ester carboxylesterase
MTGPRPILFIQGAGAGTHDEWDDRLVTSLRRALGNGYDVQYPRMPDEDDPSEDAWGSAIRDELARLGDDVVAVGHSVGGTILVHELAQRPPERRLGAIILVATPFIGDGGWPADGFELPGDLGQRLPRDVPIHVFHGLDDDTAPPEHADLFARAIPHAHLHLLPGRDHQLGSDLAEVASVIRALRPSAAPAAGE